MLNFFQNRWFLILLAAVLIAGFGFPHQLQPLAENVPQALIVATVLFLMAFPLNASHMWDAVRKPLPVLLAVFINFGLLPLVAWPLSMVLEPELGIGLMIAAAIPSTLASAAVWTRRAGGNDAVPLMGTMVTNTLCFLVTPLWLVLATGQSVNINAAEMMGRLAVIVVIPILLGQAARLVPGAGGWATNYKVPLGVIAQLGILTIVFVGAVDGGRTLALDETRITPWDWTLMLSAVVGLHLAMFAAALFIGRGIGISRPDRIGAAFSGSQKTLMIGLAIAQTYFGGLAMLPLVSYHVCQLLVDTLIADRLARNGRLAEMQQASTSPEPLATPASGN